MILGMSTFTYVHTVLSLIALVAGLIVVIGLLTSKRLDWWTALYLASAVATSATGFGFKVDSYGASHVIGGISLVVLLVAILARYVLHLAGAWRWIYAVTAVGGVYFLVFVAIAQAFKKVPALMTLAPTLSEPPFALAQLGALVVFVVLAIAAARTFRPEVSTQSRR
jgi:drug/metabolite transporter (DMT)-like permease